MPKEIRVVVVVPEKPPEVRTIPNTLAAMQEIVGGSIEIVSVAPRMVLVCNEEGKLLDLPFNFLINTNYLTDAIVGTVFFAGGVSASGDLTNLTQKQVDWLMTMVGEVWAPA